MEESTRLTDSSTLHRRKRMTSQSRPIYVDDESSTDSGCSSRGSSESNDRISRRGSADRLCETSANNTHVGCYIHQLRGHQRQSSASRSQDRLTSGACCANARGIRSKSSRSWSPSEERGSNRHNHHHHHHHLHHHHHRHHSRESASHSSSPSDAQSSDSDSLKRPSKAEVIRRALQYLRITKWQENSSNQNDTSDSSGNSNKNSKSNNNNNHSAKEKKQTKKSPRRILRDPVSYTYVKGLSGLPTQRVPRNPVQQVVAPCTCHDIIELHR